MVQSTCCWLDFGMWRLLSQIMWACWLWRGGLGEQNDWRSHWHFGQSLWGHKWMNFNFTLTIKQLNHRLLPVVRWPVTELWLCFLGLRLLWPWRNVLNWYSLCMFRTTLSTARLSGSPAKHLYSSCHSSQENQEEHSGEKPQTAH